MIQFTRGIPSANMRIRDRVELQMRKWLNHVFLRQKDAYEISQLLKHRIQVTQRLHAYTSSSQPPLTIASPWEKYRNGAGSKRVKRVTWQSMKSKSLLLVVLPLGVLAELLLRRRLHEWFLSKQCVLLIKCLTSRGGTPEP
jgi:hypothetical protein